MAEIEVSFFSARTQPASHAPVACLLRPISNSHPWGMDYSSPKNSSRRPGIDFLRFHFAQINRPLSSHSPDGRKDA